MLYLKNGTRVTYLNDSTKYRTLKSIASADYIRTHLFPDCMTGQHGRSLQPPLRISLVSIKSLATQATVENTEPGDLPQHASDIDTAVNQLFTESGTSKTDFLYEIYLDWTRLYVVIVVHSLIISQNYTNWTPTLPMQNMN